MAGRKKSIQPNQLNIQKYYSLPIWLLRSFIALFILISMLFGWFLAYKHSFTSESLKDISELIINLTFLLLGFNFSLTFLSKSIESNKIYRNNIKKFIFNAFFPLSISIFLYICSYYNFSNEKFLQLLACLGIFGITYLISRSLVFMVINFKIDQLEK